MKRRRTADLSGSSGSDGAAPPPAARGSGGEHAPGSLEEIGAQLLQASSANDPKAFAEHIMRLCGMDRETNPPTKSFSDLLAKASHEVAEAVTEGIINRIEEHDKDHRCRSAYFAAASVPVDCIAEIANYLEVGEKMQLATLNRSWKQLSLSHYLWQILDPFPVAQFSNHAALRLYLNQNKQKFLGCRQLQLPRIPTSVKLFQDIFAAMPLLNSISLFNVIGAQSLKHSIPRIPNPAGMIQLSIGLSTRVSPSEVAYALKHVGKQWLSIC
jgi:hypothetical protein